MLVAPVLWGVETGGSLGPAGWNWSPASERNPISKVIPKDERAGTGHLMSLSGLYGRTRTHAIHIHSGVGVNTGNRNKGEIGNGLWK